jgi:uncharacterized protein (TIGR03067 family)
MPRTMIVCVMLGGMAYFAVRGDSPDPEPQEETSLRTLKGTWIATKAIIKGREHKVAEGSTFNFENDQLTRTVPAGKNVGKFIYKVKLDTLKKPHKITLTPVDGGDAREGVIKIEKGQLFLSDVILRAGRVGPVPTDFSSKDAVVLVMKKGKAKE